MKRFMLGFASAVVLFIVLMAKNVVCVTADFELAKSASYERGYAIGYAEGIKCGSELSVLNEQESKQPENISYSNNRKTLIEEAEIINPTVYITNTGTKYHSWGCKYLAKSCNSISLNDAISRGYTACSVCGG